MKTSPGHHQLERRQTGRGGAADAEGRVHPTKTTLPYERKEEEGGGGGLSIIITVVVVVLVVEEQMDCYTEKSDLWHDDRYHLQGTRCSTWDHHHHHHLHHYYHHHHPNNQFYVLGTQQH